MNVAIQDQLEAENLRLEINISTTLSLSSQQAKRRLARFLMDTISLFTHPGEPLLVIANNQQVFWRFPVLLSMGRHGRLGQVGELDVDAHTGQIVISETITEEIKANAERLARSASLAAVE